MIHRDSIKEHKRWTMLHNQIVEDNRLSLKAKAALWYFLSRPPTYKVSKSRLIREMTAEKVVKRGDTSRHMRKDSRCSIETAFEELVEAGYIVKENGEWHVYETPRNAKKQHEQENNSLENQQPNIRKISIPTVGNKHSDCRNSTCFTSELRNVFKEGCKEGEGTSLPLPQAEEKELSKIDESSVAPSESLRLKEQAVEILRFYPKEEYRDFGIKPLQKAIQKEGYERMLEVTKYYASHCNYRGQTPSGAMYFYGELQYKWYFPNQDEPSELNENVSTSQDTVEEDRSEAMYQTLLGYIQGMSRGSWDESWEVIMSKKDSCFPEWFREAILASDEENKYKLRREAIRAEERTKAHPNPKYFTTEELKAIHDANNKPARSEDAIVNKQKALAFLNS